MQKHQYTMKNLCRFKYDRLPMWQLSHRLQSINSAGDSGASNFILQRIPIVEDEAGGPDGSIIGGA